MKGKRQSCKNNCNTTVVKITVTLTVKGFTKDINVTSKTECFRRIVKMHIYICLYVSLMVTTKQKHTVNIQKIVNMESKLNTEERHQTTKEGSKKRTATNKKAVNTHFAIITLNVNGLSSPIKKTE